MKMTDINFSDGNQGVFGEVDFLYTPVNQKATRWLNIASLKIDDRQAAFVFRVNQELNIFQIYFGDGQKIYGRFNIDVNKFINKFSLLKYWRGRDYTLLSLETEDDCLVRFAMHINKVAFNVPASYYQEGCKNCGMDVRRVDFTNIPLDDINLQKAEALLLNHTGIIKDWGYYDSMNSLAMAYFRLRKFDKSLEFFEAVSSSSAKLFRIVDFTKARACINQIFDSEDMSRAWGRFSSPEDLAFGEAHKSAIAGNKVHSLRVFRDAVEKTFGDNPYDFSGSEKQSLVDSFENLLQDSKGILPTEASMFSPIRIVIVSGMGRSGSSAVYDYLREFDDVTPIIGETSYIEGSDSLEMIYNSLNDDVELRIRILNFFFYALAGHSCYRGGGDFKLFKFARQKLLREDRGRYLKSIRDWCVVGSALLTARGVERSRIFSILSDLTVSQFSVGEFIPEGKLALLDNVVHIPHSHQCIKFLNRVTLLCTFRDPRSNYVAMVREWGQFTSGVEDFVKSRKIQYQENYRLVRAAADLADDEANKKVEFVQFEDFALSERYRERIASGLGLDFGRRKKHQYFKPWESVRNVILHLEHPDQNEIRMIEKELGKFCYEPCARPLLDELSDKG